MKYIEVQPQVITDDILDEIRNGVFHVHKYPDGEQTLYVPSDTPIEYFSTQFDIKRKL